MQRVTGQRKAQIEVLAKKKQIEIFRLSDIFFPVCVSECSQHSRTSEMILPFALHLGLYVYTRDAQTKVGQ